MKSIRLILFLALAALATGGCASRRINLIAHCGGTPARFEVRKLSLLPSPSRTPSERALDRDLAAELQSRGIEVVSPSESDFTLAAGLEVNWDTFIDHTPFQPYARIPPPVALRGAAVWVYSERSIVANPTPTKRYVRTEGIRLRLYPTRELKQGRFNAAWEGYIEAGLELRPERRPGLVHTLLDYLGEILWAM